MRTSVRTALELLLCFACVAAGFLLGYLSFSALDGTDDDGDEPSTVTATVDGIDGDRIADDKVTVSRVAVEQAEASEVGRHDGARNEAPTIAPKPELQAAQKQQLAIMANQEPLSVAGASQGFPGCVTRFVGNQSSRNGVRPQLIVYHYTVSANRPGWSDVNAIVALFDRPSFQASSHFVIDAEGNCAYIVPIEAKAWTAAALNPVSVQFEIINSGREGRLMDPAGYRKLAQVTREVSRRTGIPVRRGAVNGCTAARTGIVQHKDGGLCAGGHVDITPYSIDQTVRLVRSGAPVSPLTKSERRNVAHLRHHKARTAHVRRVCKANQRQRRKLRRLATRPNPNDWRKRKRGVRYQELAKAHGKACR